MLAPRPGRAPAVAGDREEELADRGVEELLSEPVQVAVEEVKAAGPDRGEDMVIARQRSGPPTPKRPRKSGPDALDQGSELAWLAPPRLRG
jgi:hypothetical protein